MTFIYNQDKAGRLRMWRTWAEGDTVNTEYSLEGGAKQTSSYVAVGVNKGKANERTAEQQAVFESAAMRRKKLETGWSEDPANAASGARFPMLAEKLKSHKKRLLKHYQAHYMVQPKLNGVRCHVGRVDEENFTFTSRKGKHFRSMYHLIPYLKKVMRIGDVFDGELYKHGVELQTISGIVRTKEPLTAEEAELIELHVYDIADTTMLSQDRNRKLSSQMHVLHTDNHIEAYYEGDCPVKCVPTYAAGCLDDVELWHKSFVSEGYEGVMVRLCGFYYEPSNGTTRSAGLLKDKNFTDAEFKIIGFKEGTGRCTGAIIFKCITDAGVEFDVKPRGPIPMLREMWENRNQYLGKMYTVRYQSITPTGSLEFPVGIAVRDYE